MVVKDRRVNEITVLTVDGEINFNSSPDFRKAFLRIPDSNLKKVVVNLAGVDYVDSSGLATLVEAYQKIKGAGGELILANLSDKVKSLFEITKLEKLFRVFQSEEEALRNIG
ncbi:MAG: STAS domain-containing protein [Candidatus Omnitrophota bacterium]